MVNLKGYLTVKEVANRLEVSEDWVRDLIQAKELKAVKMKRWRIKPGDLEKFISSRYNIKGRQ